MTTVLCNHAAEDRPQCDDTNNGTQCVETDEGPDSEHADSKGYHASLQCAIGNAEGRAICLPSGLRIYVRPRSPFSCVASVHAYTPPERDATWEVMRRSNTRRRRKTRQVFGLYELRPPFQFGTPGVPLRDSFRLDCVGQNRETVRRSSPSAETVSCLRGTFSCFPTPPRSAESSR